MGSIHLEEHNQPREKRMKVSKACYTCRIKKIKCDGVQPCMQCKARRRPCSFSKDGTVDQTQSNPQSSATTPAAEYTHEEYGHKRRHSASLSPNNETIPTITLCQQPVSSLAEIRAKEKEELNKTSQQLERLGVMWPGEGKEGRWLVDINLLFNGAEENHVQTMREFSSPSVNDNLLGLFFRHRYTTFPILPKSMFYRLLERRDPLINDLLLHSMYCNAAHFSQQDASQADHYYRQAQLLLDSYIDTPSLSTVISLCLLSTFESNRQSTGPQIGKNRSRIYSDMAFRMCHDLKLHKRYSFHHTDASTPDDNELRKRVYWACFCLDKVQSLVTGRPNLLPSKEIDIDFPMLLRSDDPSEYEINICFIEYIKLMQIAERVLELEIPNRQTGITRSSENEQMVLEIDGQLLYWLRSLPQQLQWTPISSDGDIVPTQPPANALVAQLNLVYNFVEISLLQSHASTSLSSSPATLMIQQRCATVATNLTQLTCAMADQPNFIMSFTLVSEAIMASVRVHIMDCADEKMNVARHARFMFQRSIRSLRSILHHRVIDRIQEFTTTIEKALADADTGNSSSRNGSPKIHVLSPVIPRTNAPPSISQLQSSGEQHTPVNLDERWSTSRFSNNSSNLYSYGIISPASSTASAPVEKSSISRDEQLVRPHSAMPPTMDPYSRTSTSSFMPATSSSSTTWKSPVVSGQQLSPIKSFERSPSTNSQLQEQQQMEMYSSIWSRPGQSSNDVFASGHGHFDTSFLATTSRQLQQQQRLNNDTQMDKSTSSYPTTTSSVNMMADAELYTMWDGQPEKTNERTEGEQALPIVFTPQQTRYGLGVYASAQQHHTDVIRQHIPHLKSNSSHRPVVLNHHGQVVVIPSDRNIN